MILKQKLAILLDIKIVFVDDDKDEESFDRFRLSACVGLYGLNTKNNSPLPPCYYYNLINGYNYLTNPKYTSLLAYQYKTKTLPTECLFVREFYQIIDKHKVTNNNMSYMFTTVILQMRQKKQMRIFINLILKELVKSGFYEDWACILEHNFRVFEIIKGGPFFSDFV